MPRSWKDTLGRAMGLSVVLVAALLACDSPDALQGVRELQAQRRFEESLDPLRELLDKHPDNPEIQYRYGVALDRTGRPDQAVFALRSAREHSEWAVPAGLALATASLTGQNWENAIEATTRVLEREPEHVRALGLRAEAQLGKMTEPERALEDLERALALEPDHLGLLTARIRALLVADRIDEAALALGDLESRGAEASLEDPVLAKLCLAYASLADARGKTEDATTRFGGCLERYATDPSVVEGAVAFFDAQGRPDRANELLRLALEQEPKFLRYRKTLAERLRRLGGYEESEQLLRAGVDVEGVALVTGALAALAEHYIEVDDLDAAVAAYKRAIEMVPEPAPLVLLTYADLLARAERHPEALAVAAQLSNDAYRGVIEARVHLNEGQPQRALARLDEILPTWPDNPGARYYAARAAEQIGSFDRAIEEYRQSIRSDASATDAGLRLAKLHAAEGNDASAWTVISHYAKAHPRDAAGVAFAAELASRIGPSVQAQFEAQLQQLRQNALWGEALAIRSDLQSRLRGPEAALAHIRSIRGLNLEHPRNAEALRALVVYSIAANSGEEAGAILDKALAANPDVADFHEIRGVWLEGFSKRPEEALAAYRRALELDADHFRAQEALGRLAEQSGNVDVALGYYDGARDADPDVPTAARRAARLAEAAGRTRDAENRWEALLEEHPWDSEAAIALARLSLARGAPQERTLELAHRAVRFQGGPTAQALLDEIQAASTPLAHAAERLD